MLKLLNQYPGDCTGCGACYNICPKDAIEMKPDAQGFLYPHIAEEKCIHCGKCESVCPKLEHTVQNSTVPDCYAARATDEIRKKSSSGGMFTVLAQWILQQNGIVCGAAMESDYSVHHICVSDEAELDRLRKSKYVQSNTEKVYRDLEPYVRQGRPVLFTGCPCQVAAARKYFGPKAYNVFYLDILCHGVPSLKMWKDYIHENFDLNTVDSIDFRNKKNGWRADQLFVTWKDGSASAITWPESAYEEGFQRNISLRDGCENCEFSGIQRQGDLTIGDFWQVEKYDASLNDGKGTSLLLVNNEVGQNMLDAIKPQLLDLTKTPIEAAKHNRLKETFPSHPMKARFKTLYPGRTYTDAVFQCRHALYDIGLIGNYTIGNYGGGLTQYALYCTLSEMGYSVLMIERPLNARERPHTRPWMFAASPYPQYALCRYYNNVAEMKFINKQCRTFVTGSDQMFNNNLYNDYAKIPAQNFVYNNQRKIAYAASFGHDRIWGEESDRAEESYFMKKFDAFSVREKSAVELGAKLFGVDAVWVLDPVFLCPIEKYIELTNNAPEKPPESPYLFAYVLDPNPEKERILRNISGRRKLGIQAVCDAQDDTNPNKLDWDIKTLGTVKIESWLSHIYHSDFVVTDSFHGMCFCIIFHKQFLALVNKRRGEARFTSLTELLHLEDRLCYSENELLEKGAHLPDIDYSPVDEILKAERSRCRDWLRNAIERDADVKKPMDTFDILDGRCDDLCLRFDKRCDALQSSLERLDRQLKTTEDMVECIKRSKSYLIGRAITWLPRKIKKLYYKIKSKTRN